MENGYPKFQYSIFGANGDQYVVRTEDREEFKELVKSAKIASGSAFNAPQKPNPAPTSDSKPKVPYMWSGDSCPVCGKGVMTRTIKESKIGEKYDALVCDQQGCKGYAYVSKFPKKFEATGQVDFSKNENDLPF